MTYVLTGRYPLGSLDGRPGVLKFEPSTTIVGDGNVVLPAPVSVRLDADGAFSQALIGTDDPLYAPSGWVWTVTEVMTGGRAAWSFELTADSDLADLTAVATPADVEYNVTRAEFAAAVPTGVRYLDAFNSFFGGSRPWVTGQTSTSTALTAAVSPGATVLPVLSAAGLVAGMSLLLGAGTATQEIVVVQSVASLNVTVTPALTTGRSGGAAVSPLWDNSTHLQVWGYTAYAYWIANHPALTDMHGKVVVFGDSWFSQGLDLWSDAITAAYPGTTVVNAGTAGYDSAALIANFATDVPADADFVIINEPGINDIVAGLSLPTMAAHMETIVGLIRGIGAVPVVTGHVPAAGFLTQSAAAATAEDQQIGDGLHFPAVPMSAVDGRGFATLASPALTGTPTAPSATAVTDSTQIATTAFVHDVVVVSRPNADDYLAQVVQNVGGSTITKTVFYDSGWRDVSGLLSVAGLFELSGTNGFLHLRRVGQQIYLKGRIKATASITGTYANYRTIFSFPTGFSPNPTGLPFSAAALINSAAPAQIGTGYGSSTVVEIFARQSTTTWVAGHEVQLSATWDTSTVIPASLPGVASPAAPA